MYFDFSWILSSFLKKESVLKPDKDQPWVKYEPNIEYTPTVLEKK